MEKQEIIKNIAARSGGDIYLGVVGAVRTGKSTFIKKMVETLVVPNIEDEYERKRALDEIPQSAAGKTIMTTEPKFVPNEAIEITLDDNLKFKTRLVDCVGYLVDNAIGYLEDDMPRMVKTPWSTEEIPFEKAAEIGTKKVIEEHSTIGILVTTDGTITDIPREDYIKAEERVVSELKSLHKPFVIVLNSYDPSDSKTRELAENLSDKYQCSVIPMNCSNLRIDDINSNYDHNYEIGIVICHDGRVYMYSAEERINVNYYKLTVEDYLKNGYNEDTAQIEALKEMQKKFSIYFKEVTEDDCV